MRCEPALPLIGFILGPLLEENVRRALLISRGDPTVFFTRPISAAFLAAAILLLVIVSLPRRRTREAQAEIARAGVAEPSKNPQA